ncbi:MAG TPA: phage tail protein [Chloroflexota bacterium]|jgi:phage tail-like protein|nr:phage tail protein [Chloroflexota bacterium]
MAGNTTGARNDPAASYHFRLDVSALPDVADFTECSGLEMQVKFDEVREGGNNLFVHRLPTRVEYGNLVLKRGLVRRNEFFTWCASIVTQNKVKRQNVTVHLIDRATKSTLVSWTFLNAYPVKWSGPSFKANSTEISIESLELAHEGLQFQ